jgi:hypothetical protein
MEAEISPVVMVYNLKRMIAILGGDRLAAALAADSTPPAIPSQI